MLVLLFSLTALYVGIKAHPDGGALFKGCDHKQTMFPNVTYYVHNIGYPDHYKPGTSCRWRAEAPLNTQISLTCEVLQIEKTESCEKQHLLVFLNGPTEPDMYCGSGSFSAISKKNRMKIVLVSDPSSLGGRFDCTVKIHYPKDKAEPVSCSCGIKKKTRALGGTITKVNEYPMMAALLSKEYLFCGATIISNRYVLTSAHCSTRKSIPETRVLVGDHDITIGDETDAARIYNVHQIRVHEKYNKVTGVNNIAIIKTSKEIYFSERVMPACLPFKYKDSTFIGTKMTAMGWGQMHMEETQSAVLNKVVLDVVPSVVCENFYGNSLSNSSFCTFTPYKSPCEDDSGGPLLYEDEAGILYSTGIILHEKNSCDSKAPGVNVNVAMYLDWIIENTKDAKYCEKD